jgi:putative transcriptional regulator
MESLQGQFLIASPHLHDPNFCRSVVLLLEHHDEGALGIIINRESQTRLGEVWEKAGNGPCECNLSVSMGGPVKGPLISLHGHPQLSESEILPGVYVATKQETLIELVEQNVQPFRVFSGYAGWGPGQLEGELGSGGWLHIFGTAAHIFSEDQSALWQAVLKESGQDFFRDTLGIRNFPDDAGLN